MAAPLCLIRRSARRRLTSTHCRDLPFDPRVCWRGYCIHLICQLFPRPPPCLINGGYFRWSLCWWRGWRRRLHSVWYRSRLSRWCSRHPGVRLRWTGMQFGNCMRWSGWLFDNIWWSDGPFGNVRWGDGPFCNVWWNDGLLRNVWWSDGPFCNIGGVTGSFAMACGGLAGNSVTARAAISTLLLAHRAISSRDAGALDAGLVGIVGMGALPPACIGACRRLTPTGAAAVMGCRRLTPTGATAGTGCGRLTPTGAGTDR
jgi:hypothetical protein